MHPLCFHGERFEVSADYHEGVAGVPLAPYELESVTSPLQHFLVLASESGMLESKIWGDG